MSQQKPTVAIAINTSWNIYNFRLKLVRALQQEGYGIAAIAPKDEFTEKLIEMGVAHHDVSLSSSSRNPFYDLRYLRQMARILRQIKPVALLNFTAKPNVYGSVAARLNQVPVINNVAGLGSGFVDKTLLTSLLITMYRLAFAKAGHIFFQNPDDLAFFVEENISDAERSSLLPGSGVDLERFAYQELRRSENDVFKFVFVARMLKSKGIPELLEAAENLNREFEGKFIIEMVGAFDADNRDRISRRDVELHAERGYVNIVGRVDDVFPILTASHCMVLPSYYREGTPRSILEALAVGRPIITTDMPGCRETITAENGVMIEPRNADDLYCAMKELLLKSATELTEMGRASRRLAESKYSDTRIIEAYIKTLSHIIRH